MRLPAQMCPQLVDAPGKGLGGQQHALAPAEHRVIHTAPGVGGKVPQLVAAHLQQPLLPGPADDAVPQHRGEHLREQGEDIHPHLGFLPFLVEDAGDGPAAG